MNDHPVVFTHLTGDEVFTLQRLPCGEFDTRPVLHIGADSIYFASWDQLTDMLAAVKAGRPRRARTAARGRASTSPFGPVAAGLVTPPAEVPA